MRWTAVPIVLTVAAFVVAAAWMGWVMSRGTNQVIQPGWWAFEYAAPLMLALAFAVAALVSMRIRPPDNRTAAMAIGVTAGLEVCLFGVVWTALVGGPLSP